MSAMLECEMPIADCLAAWPKITFGGRLSEMELVQ